MITVSISRSALAQMSQVGKKGEAAMAAALNTTAAAAKAALQDEMKQSLDRPTQYTLGSLLVRKATSRKLQARVSFAQKKQRGNSASSYLSPNIIGGPRRLKGFERALQATGYMPEGMHAVPSRASKKDEHGNMPRAQIMDVLWQMRNQPKADMTTRRGKKQFKKLFRRQLRKGNSYFAIQPGEGLLPGIYRRDFMGDGIAPVLLFVRRSTYKPRYPFAQKAEEVVEKVFPVSFSDHLTRAFSKAFS